ncbi:MAG: DegT/DnrJ/EryC1/StrS family aminotransferase, partial [Pseudomonadota bacterium]
LPIRVPAQVGHGRHAHHLFAIHVDPAQRDAILSNINAAGIGATVNYRALQTLSLFKEDQVDAPVALEWGQGTLSLPLYPSLTQDAQDIVIAAVESAVCGQKLRKRSA